MKTGDDMPQQPEKTPAVFVIHGDVLPGIAPDGDVVEGAGIFNAEWASHGAYSSSRRCAMLDLTASSSAWQQSGFLGPPDFFGDYWK